MNKTARNKGYNIHTNKTQQQAIKHNTLFGHYPRYKEKTLNRRSQHLMIG